MKTVLPLESGLVIEQIRNARYAVNDYAQFVECPEWEGHCGKAMSVFRMVRREYPFASLDMMPMIADQIVVNRTNRIMTIAQGANTAGCNELNNDRGNWQTASSDPASHHYLAIKRSIETACRCIKTETDSVIKRKDLRLVISLPMMDMMLRTDEIRSYTQYDFEDTMDERGFLKSLYGIKICVDTTPLVYVRGSCEMSKRCFAKDDASALLLSRVGDRNGEYEEEKDNLSSVKSLYKGPEMSVWKTDDGFSITEESCEVLANQTSGFLITGCYQEAP